MIATLPHVKNGKLHGLAVSSAKRSELAPELPTVAEATGLKNFVTGSWQGFLAAAGTPPATLERLHVEIEKATKPAQSDTWRAEQVANWAKVVKDTGIKLE